jgi:hypothetical protein
VVSHVDTGSAEPAGDDRQALVAGIAQQPQTQWTILGVRISKAQGPRLIRSAHDEGIDGMQGLGRIGPAGETELLLRHSNVTTTLGLYAHGNSAAKMTAQEACISELLSKSGNAENRMRVESGCAS